MRRGNRPAAPESAPSPGSTRSAEPGKMPVLFDPRVASILLGHFVGAITGSSVARKSSFLQDKLGARSSRRA